MLHKYLLLYYTYSIRHLKWNKTKFLVVSKKLCSIWQWWWRRGWWRWPKCEIALMRVFYYYLSESILYLYVICMWPYWRGERIKTWFEMEWSKSSTDKYILIHGYFTFRSKKIVKYRFSNIGNWRQYICHVKWASCIANQIYSSINIITYVYIDSCGYMSMSMEYVNLKWIFVTWPTNSAQISYALLLFLFLLWPLVLFLASLFLWILWLTDINASKIEKLKIVRETPAVLSSQSLRLRHVLCFLCCCSSYCCAARSWCDENRLSAH